MNNTIICDPCRAIISSTTTRTCSPAIQSILWLAVMDLDWHMQASPCPAMVLAVWGLRLTFLETYVGRFRLSLIETHSAHPHPLSYRKTTRKIFRPCARVDCRSHHRP